MEKAVTERVLQTYGIDYVDIYEVQKGYRNKSYPIKLPDNKFINLIYFKHAPDSLERVNRADSVAAFADKTGLPIRTRYDKRIIKLAPDRHAGVYTYLPGRTIAWEAYTKKHIKLLGWSLAAFHEAVKDYDQPLPSVAAEYQQIFKRVEKYFADEQVNSAIKRKLHLSTSFSFPSIQKFLAKCELLTHKQALHMDFVRGNVLYRDAKSDDQFVIDQTTMSGIIDLEKVAYGHPMFDIARTLAFLLVDCPKPADKIYRYLLDSGYRKRGKINIQPIAIEGQDLLEQLIIIFLIYDFYKFLRQNPYESLSDNHHFVRTSDLLIQTGILSPIFA